MSQFFYKKINFNKVTFNFYLIIFKYTILINLHYRACNNQNFTPNSPNKISYQTKV